MKTIQIPENVKYLSEILSDFPANCIFDKGRIGAGATVLGITNAENYVIVVPFVSLIENKERQHPNQVIGVYSNTKDAAIKKYIKARKEAGLPVKILVTYDSLPRVTSLLLAINEDLLDYSILIDEYHLLFTQYPFRKDAVKPRGSLPACTHDIIELSTTNRASTATTSLSFTTNGLISIS